MNSADVAQVISRNYGQRDWECRRAETIKATTFYATVVAHVGDEVS